MFESTVQIWRPPNQRSGEWVVAVQLPARWATGGGGVVAIVPIRRSLRGRRAHTRCRGWRGWCDAGGGGGSNRRYRRRDCRDTGDAGAVAVAGCTAAGVMAEPCRSSPLLGPLRARPVSPKPTPRGPRDLSARHPSDRGRAGRDWRSQPSPAQHDVYRRPERRHGHHLV